MEQQQNTQAVATLNGETNVLPSFSDSKSFEHAQRVANMLIQSNLIPANYQKNMPNTMIALEIANRIGASPLMVMQNLYIVQGRPSWSSTFIIASLNSSGKFSPLRFAVSGDGDTLDCYAWAIEKGTKEKLIGSTVSMKMAKDEGWIDKNGSKWKTMPGQMIRYRAASFFGRLYAPEILMGMHTEDEVEDFVTLATESQIAKIESLLQTSLYNDQQKAQMLFDIKQDISADIANAYIKDLQLNQQDPITQSGNHSQTDIKKKIAKQA